jgi:hypothetical protein
VKKPLRKLGQNEEWMNEGWKIKQKQQMTHSTLLDITWNGKLKIRQERW